MKAAALHSFSSIVLNIFNIWFIAATGCLAISFICWQAALRQRPVSFLHPFCSLVYVFTPALSVLFFQENISAKYCVGIFCIIAGVCITSISVLPVSSGNGKPGKDRC
ncbi:MAG: EamA family transporter [Bacteroidales bacterium]|nr:EamA family transporter [Bacteroidales bacterium]